MKKLIAILIMAFVFAMVSCDNGPTDPKVPNLGVVLTSEMLKLAIPTAIKTDIETTTAAVPNYNSGGESTLPDPASVSVSGVAASINVSDIKTVPDAAVIVPTDAILTAFNETLQPDSTIINGVVPSNAFTVTWILEPDAADPVLTLSGTAIAKSGYFIPNGLDKYIIKMYLTSSGGIQDKWAEVTE